MTTKRGYTLVELLLVIAIAGVLFVAIFNSLISSTRAHEKQSALSSSESDFESILLSFEADAARAGFLTTDPEAATWFASNWPSGYPSLDVQHDTDFDSITIRWVALDGDCPSSPEYSVTLSSGRTACLRKVSYYVDDGKLIRDLDEAGPVEIGRFATEAFKIFFRNSSGDCSEGMPAANDVRSVAAYIRVAAPYKGNMGCGTYPSPEVISPFGSASDLGLRTVTYSTCSGVLRMEQVVSTSLVNQQWY